MLASVTPLRFVRWLKQVEKRARKMDNPYMVSGRYLLDFFEAKLRASTSSLFEELRRKVFLLP